MWISCDQVMNNSCSSNEQVMSKPWTSCKSTIPVKKVVNMSWTSHEQVVNKLWASNEQGSTSHEQVMKNSQQNPICKKKSWTSCEQAFQQVVNNSGISFKQVANNF